MKVATYTNRETGETLELAGVKNIGDAWSKSKLVCDTMNWNHEMFAEDVKVEIKSTLHQITK